MIINNFIYILLSGFYFVHAKIGLCAMSGGGRLGTKRGTFNYAPRTTENEAGYFTTFALIVSVHPCCAHISRRHAMLHHALSARVMH